MRKLIFMAVAGFLWRKFQEKRASDKVAAASNRRTV